MSGIVEQWAVVKVDFQGCGTPSISVLDVKSGPKAEAEAYSLRTRLERNNRNQVSVHTQIRGDVSYLVKKVSDKEA